MEATLPTGYRASSRTHKPDSHKRHSGIWPIPDLINHEHVALNHYRVSQAITSSTVPSLPSAEYFPHHSLTVSNEIPKSHTISDNDLNHHHKTLSHSWHQCKAATRAFYIKKKIKTICKKYQLPKTSPSLASLKPSFLTRK